MVVLFVHLYMFCCHTVYEDVVVPSAWWYYINEHLWVICCPGQLDLLFCCLIPLLFIDLCTKNRHNQLKLWAWLQTEEDVMSVKYSELLWLISRRHGNINAIWIKHMVWNSGRNIQMRSRLSNTGASFNNSWLTPACSCFHSHSGSCQTAIYPREMSAVITPVLWDNL